MSTHNLRPAYESYKYLRDRGFPEKATLALVGDRYRLTRVQRNCLFRGAVETAVAAQRLQKLVQPGRVAGQSLGLDWYNVLITVESYLKGVTVILADDGVLRDSMAAHGSYRMSGVTEGAIASIMDGLAALAPSRIDVFLDSPIAFSGRMAEELRMRMAGSVVQFEVSLDRSADFALKGYEGIVASADSVVLDSAREFVDLPRFVLERSHGFRARRLPDLDF
jgi:hypothetical protein